MQPTKSTKEKPKVKSEDSRCLPQKPLLLLFCWHQIPPLPWSHQRIFSQIWRCGGSYCIFGWHNRKLCRSLNLQLLCHLLSLEVCMFHTILFWDLRHTDFYCFWYVPCRGLLVIRGIPSENDRYFVFFFSSALQ